MDRNGRPRRRFSTPAVEPTTITECARRYHGAALALAKSFGLPLTADFLQAYHAAIAAVYIEASRAGVRLPPAVQLPGLVPGTSVPPEPEPASDPRPPGEGEAPVASPNDAVPTIVCTLEVDVSDVPPPPDPAPAPLIIPVGLPCAGQLISALKPAALMMVIHRVAALVHAEGEAWVPLLGALQVERAARLERGKRYKAEG